MSPGSTGLAEWGPRGRWSLEGAFNQRIPATGAFIRPRAPVGAHSFHPATLRPSLAQVLSDLQGENTLLFPQALVLVQGRKLCA